MPWVRVDDQFTEHPKAVGRSPIALTIWLSAMCYAGRNLTDGAIDAAMIPRLANALPKACQSGAEELVKAGLWERTETGYMIHDYLDYNPSREEVLAKRAKDSARKGRGIREESAGNLYGTDADSEDIPRAPIPIPIPDPLDDVTSRLPNDPIGAITTGRISPGNAEQMINYGASRLGRVPEASETYEAHPVVSDQELSRRRADPAWGTRKRARR